MRDRTSYLRYQAAVILCSGKVPACQRDACGNTNLDELVVNHRRRDGARDRSETRPGVALYRKIIRLGSLAQQTYELCCANHNLSDERRYYRGEQVYDASSGTQIIWQPLPLFGERWDQSLLRQLELEGVRTRIQKARHDARRAPGLLGALLQRALEQDLHLCEWLIQRRKDERAAMGVHEVRNRSIQPLHGDIIAAFNRLAPGAGDELQRIVTAPGPVELFSRPLLGRRH